jgi:hypothetical protein
MWDASAAKVGYKWNVGNGKKFLFQEDSESTTVQSGKNLYYANSVR